MFSPEPLRGERSRSPPSMSDLVKVFGCRPHDGGAARTGAGVRKPPMEETALGGRRTEPRARAKSVSNAGQP